MSSEGNNFCVNALTLDPVQIFGKPVGAVMVLVSMLYLFMSILVIVAIKREEWLANQDEEDEGVHSTIFPAFVNFLWLNAAINIYVGFIGLTFTFAGYSNTTYSSAWAFAIMWGLQHVLVEGISVMLMQKGLGMFAGMQALKYISGWGVVTVIMQLIRYAYPPPSSIGFAVDLAWQAMLLIFYFMLWLTPQKYLFRRPASFIYAKFWFWFRVVAMLGSILSFSSTTTEGVGTCISVFASIIPFAVLEPLIVYYTLLQDSRWSPNKSMTFYSVQLPDDLYVRRWWQGLDINQGWSTSGEENIRSPLEGNK